ncbi:AAA family ATPase [Mesorhizobium sp. NPDC059054]|uniref:AAA family ATPase n=1 Tax=unclassified Mesorhizobium TaxID=325217 RepID=UPI003677B612
MIKVGRLGANFPPTLASDDAIAARRAVEEVLLLSIQARAQRRIPFEARVYGAEDVRKSLYAQFEGRCAFCENDLRNSEWPVHHFRPLRSASDSSAKFPDEHYAWFAYEWGNLYPVCGDCHRAKKSNFPVKGRRAAPFSSLDEARNIEAALLLDPDIDDPSRHLIFRWNGECEPSSERGEVTVATFDLNRWNLVEERRDSAHRLFEFLNVAPSRPPTDVIVELNKLVRLRPGLSGALLKRFVDDIWDRSARRSRSRGPFDALQAFLKDMDSEVYGACLEEALSEFRSDPGSTGSYIPGPIISEPMISVARAQPLLAHDFQFRSININGFKALRSIRFQVPERRNSTYGAPCLMLLGENASGKSSILEAIALALIGTEAASKVAGPPSDYLRRKDPRRWALVDPEPMSIAIDFFGLSDPVELRVDPARQVFEGPSSPTALVLAYGPRRFFSKGGRMRQGGAERYVRTLFDPMATIRHPGAWLNRLRGDKFDAVARVLREVFVLRLDDELIRDGEMGVSVRANGLLTPLDRMSEGYKSLFAMTVDVMRGLMGHWDNLDEARAIILIDEIETHLHPRWKMRVMAALRRALPYVTFIATTHDPLCLRGLDDGEVSVLVRDEQQNIETLDDLPSIKGLRADQLLTSDFFGLSSTADPEMEERLSLYAGLLTTPVERRSTSEQAKLREVESELAQTLVIGDTAVDQVVAQAMRQFVEARQGAPVAQRTAARQRMVSALLDALNQPPRT